MSGSTDRAGVHATVHDVAREAGVSPMTVSRVLNASPNVAPATRKRVEDAIVRLGYRRNETARALRPGQRSGLIGVVITNVANPYYAAVLNGIEDVASGADRRIVVGMSHGDAAEEAAIVADLVGRQCEGLIVVPAGGSSQHLQPATRGDLPLVLASRAQAGVPADTVLIDDLSGARDGVASLLAQGYRRIAFIGNGEQVSTSQRRYEGYAAAHKAASVGIDPALVRRDCPTRDAAREATGQLLARRLPPEAVFATNNRLAIGALERLLPWRDEHPDRPVIPLLAFDSFDLSHLVPYPITLVDHDARFLGRTSARLLLQRLEGEQDAPHVVVTLPTHTREPVPPKG